MYNLHAISFLVGSTLWYYTMYLPILKPIFSPEQYRTRI